MADRTELVKTPNPIIGLFNYRDSAERAYQELLNYGYTQDEITIVMTDESHKLHFPLVESEIEDKTLKGLGLGRSSVVEWALWQERLPASAQ